MKLEKGKIYDVLHQEWMEHNRAEYHSTRYRESDNEPLHDMIIRMVNGDLDMGLFFTKEIVGLSENQSI
ncbi:hypothetical protein [Xenorhabdus bovienii]|uniref:Uncharacterized protein n=2 Tax=Xenorhabdus bovienii TaxID=40576 RepID=A0A077QJM4_XENBV|nr:hypothetical protein [Xenorhabdus bovienii]MDE1484621.1 hypothetical protein [Xenorhabdus bovienii]MDE9484072.1 hypothetical protein [Xenorhabdus bovienii]MDE9537842.1 hypothetical protein [Xenorhabdus bovienii]MDE9549612.1 hypothetical protein [Xenorhabdus bovienii]CDH33749.1 hypothetical protein XBI1_2770005 [Xenorhabdus bovienii str. Intermedium]